MECELSVVMPCLNEVRTLESCILKARGFFEREAVSGEIVVADNGSTDGSQALAARLGARVVPVAQRGYGAALRAGFAAAQGRYAVMGDSDDSYDFSMLAPFLERLRAGDDIVVGNRFKGGIAPGAMPPMHRYFGNPLLSHFARICLLRSARLAPHRHRPAGSPELGHGVRTGDGGQGQPPEHANIGGADHALA